MAQPRFPGYLNATNPVWLCQTDRTLRSVGFAGALSPAMPLLAGVGRGFGVIFI